MARKINFRSRVAEVLDTSDAISFQTIIKNKLNESLNLKKLRLVEEVISENDSESFIVNQLAATASSFGGNDAVYDMGVMDIRFNDPKAVKHFTEQLDGVDGVDYYEINGPEISVDNDTGETDLEYQGNKPVYEVTVYLDFDNVSLSSDIDAYMESLNTESDDADSVNEGKKMEDDSEDSEDDEDMEDSEDDECEDDEDEMKESIDFQTIIDSVSLNEFLTVKTAHWNQSLKKAVASTDKVCPPGRTGADCKTILTAQQKMELRKRMSAHLRKLSKSKRTKMSAHASATSAFIKQHNLMSKSAAKAKLGK